jgi:hypothetical protein
VGKNNFSEDGKPTLKVTGTLKPAVTLRKTSIIRAQVPITATVDPLKGLNGRDDDTDGDE